MLHENILDISHRSVASVQSRPVAAYSKEMGCASVDLHRQLLKMFGPEDVKIDKGRERINITSGDSSVIIDYTEQADRRLGSLKLPVTNVEFRFKDFSDEEAYQFIVEFDRAFLRMGGG